MTKIIALNQSQSTRLKSAIPERDIVECVRASTKNLQDVLHLIEQSLKNNLSNETKDTHCRR